MPIFPRLGRKLHFRSCRTKQFLLKSKAFY
jgi:hypothetical protein